jgi:excisionase family DNA binding protein
MRIEEAARQLGISRTTLKRLEKRGLIPVRKDCNGQRRAVPLAVLHPPQWHCLYRAALEVLTSHGMTPLCM